MHPSDVNSSGKSYWVDLFFSWLDHTFSIYVCVGGGVCLCVCERDRESEKECLCGNLTKWLIGYSSVLERAALLKWADEDDAPSSLPEPQHTNLTTAQNNLPLCAFVRVYLWANVCLGRVCVCHRGVFLAIWALLPVSATQTQYFVICSSLVLYEGDHIDDYLVDIVINELSLWYWAITFSCFMPSLLSEATH